MPTPTPNTVRAEELLVVADGETTPKRLGAWLKTAADLAILLTQLGIEHRWVGTRLDLKAPSGDWVIGPNLKGEPGINGTDGADGEDGAPGEDGKAVGLYWTGRSDINDVDPGMGFLAFNSTAPHTTTQVFINRQTNAGVTVSGWFEAMDDVNNPNKGILHIANPLDPNVFAIFMITGAVQASGNYYKLPVQYVTHSTTFTNSWMNGASLVANFSPAGNRGSDAVLGTLSLETLTDVTTVGVKAGDTLIFKDGEWKPGKPEQGAVKLSELTDVMLAGAVEGDVLTLQGASWKPRASGNFPLDRLSDVSTAGAVNGNALVFKDGNWVPGVVASGGGDPAASGWKELGSIVITTPQPSVQFTNVSQDYDDLMVVFTGLSHDGSSNVTLHAILGDGTLWSSQGHAISPAMIGTTLVDGRLYIRDYARTDLVMYRTEATYQVRSNTPPTFANATISGYTLTGTVKGVSIGNFNGVNLDAGTIKLYGRKYGAGGSGSGGGVATLDELTDVNTAGATEGQVLTREGTAWVAKTPTLPAINLDALTDVSIGGAAEGDVLTLEEGMWVPKASQGGPGGGGEAVSVEWEEIARVVVDPASPQSAIDFLNLPQDYDDLMVVADDAMHNGSTQSINAAFSEDNATWSAGSLAITASLPTSSIGNGKAYLRDYTDELARWEPAWTAIGGTPATALLGVAGSGAIRTSSGLKGLRVQPASTGSITAGTFVLYGRKYQSTTQMEPIPVDWYEIDSHTFTTAGGGQFVDFIDLPQDYDDILLVAENLTTDVPAGSCSLGASWTIDNGVTWPTMDTSNKNISLGLNTQGKANHAYIKIPDYASAVKIKSVEKATVQTDALPTATAGSLSSVYTQGAINGLRLFIAESDRQFTGGTVKLYVRKYTGSSEGSGGGGVSNLAELADVDVLDAVNNDVLTYDNGTWVPRPAAASSAALVPFTPTGNLAATNVAAALQELDAEKASLVNGKVPAAQLPDYVGGVIKIRRAGKIVNLPLPAGYQWPSMVDPVNHDREVLVVWGERPATTVTGIEGRGEWVLTLSRKSYSWKSTDDDTIVFEVREGDQYSDPGSGWTDPATSERSELQSANLVPIQDELRLKWTSKVVGNNTSPWCVLMQCFARGHGDSPPIALTLNSTGDLELITRYGQSTEDAYEISEAVRYTLDITSGVEYTFDLRARYGIGFNGIGAGYLTLLINDVAVVNLNMIDLGYGTQQAWEPTIGIYRYEAPEVIQHHVKAMLDSSGTPSRLHPLTTQNPAVPTGAVVYVSTTGNDANNGSSAVNAVRTLARAAQLVSPGTTVVMKGGVYPQQTFWAVGEADNRITIQPEQNETVIIDGKNSPADTTAFDVGGEYVDVSHLIVRNATRTGIVLWETKNCRVMSCLVHSCWKGGIWIGGATVGASANNQVRDCEVYDCVRENIAQALGSSGWAVAIALANSDGSTIEGCNVHHCWGEGIGALSCIGATLNNNIVHDVFSVGIYLDNAQNATVTNNDYYHSNDSTYYRTSPAQGSAYGIQVANEFTDRQLPSSGQTFTNNTLGGSIPIHYSTFGANTGWDNPTLTNNTTYATPEEYWIVKSNG